MSEERPGPQSAPSPENNLLLRQMEGLRHEFAAVLAKQARDRELITRLFSRTEQGFADVRQDIRELKNDVFSLENGLLNRQNEILDIVRRLDETGMRQDGVAVVPR